MCCELARAHDAVRTLARARIRRPARTRTWRRRGRCHSVEEGEGGRRFVARGRKKSRNCAKEKKTHSRFFLLLFSPTRAHHVASQARRRVSASCVKLATARGWQPQPRGCVPRHTATDARASRWFGGGRSRSGLCALPGVGHRSRLTAAHTRVRCPGTGSDRAGRVDHDESGAPRCLALRVTRSPLTPGLGGRTHTNTHNACVA